MKHRYTVTHENGEVFERTTDRTYTHVVVVKSRDRQAWGIWSWCGREDLAQKELKRAMGSSWVAAGAIVAVDNPRPEAGQ